MQPVQAMSASHGNRRIPRAFACGTIRNQPMPTASSRSNHIWFPHLLRMCSVPEAKRPFGGYGAQGEEQKRE